MKAPHSAEQTADGWVAYWAPRKAGSKVAAMADMKVEHLADQWAAQMDEMKAATKAAMKVEMTVPMTVAQRVAQRVDPTGLMLVVWWVACWVDTSDRQKTDGTAVKWVGM